MARSPAKPNTRPRAASKGDAVVSVYLQGLADRGVFRGFHEIPGRNGKTAFEFAWLFERPFRLIVDTSTGTLVFKDLLPNMTSRSPEYAGVKRFVAGKSDPSLRPHRRVDPKAAELSCNARTGNTSLVLHVKRNQYTYGIRTLVNMTNELFTYLHMHEAVYLTVNFGLPEE